MAITAGPIPYYDPVDGHEVQFIGQTVSHLCSLFPRPLILTGLFRELLIRHFAKAEYIETPDLAKMLWRGDEQTSILIESIHRWRPELTERRPAVIVKRNSFSNRRLGIADRNQGPSTDRFGSDHYNTFWIGSHTLFCIAGSGATAELLGTEVYREIHQFHPIIRASAMLHRLQVTEVGAVSEIEESTENFVVPITVGYAFQESWTLSQESPPLRAINFSTILEC